VRRHQCRRKWFRQQSKAHEISDPPRQVFRPPSIREGIAVITVSLLGGLGNQMFQYAAGKALAERHGVPLALDLSGFRSYELRPFLLNRLCVPEGEANAEVSHHFTRSLWRQRFNRVLARARLPELGSSTNHYREPHFHYDPAFETLGPAASLFGYFQSERYFSAIAETLRNHFLPREPLRDGCAEMRARIDRSQRPVSVHVRRGDYLKSGTAEFHGILGEAYYRRAIDRIEAGIGEGTDLFVFSDDPEAARQVLNFVTKSRLIHVRGDPERPWEDLALMARCRHHVIANSSFSWWGAWLNPSPDKVVIAPRAWFTPDELRLNNTSDLYPSDWIVV
jgi:glycosyl transferase family 11